VKSLRWNLLTIGGATEAALAANENTGDTFVGVDVTDEARLESVAEGWHRVSRSRVATPTSNEFRLVALMTFADGSRHTLAVDRGCSVISKDGVPHALDANLFRLLLSILPEEHRRLLSSSHAPEPCHEFGS
jgi:hypothetical protein